MNESSTGLPRSIQRLRSAASRFTTPLLPDDYLTLLNPLWSARELRGKIVKVVPETDDAATLVIKPGLGLVLRPPARPVRGHRGPGRRPLPLAVVLPDLAAQARRAATSRSPSRRSRRASSPSTSCAASRPAPSSGSPRRRVTSCSPSRRRRRSSSSPRAAGSRRSWRSSGRSTDAGTMPDVVVVALRARPRALPVLRRADRPRRAVRHGHRRSAATPPRTGTSTCTTSPRSARTGPSARRGSAARRDARRGRGGLGGGRSRRAAPRRALLGQPRRRRGRGRHRHVLPVGARRSRSTARRRCSRAASRRA